MHIELTTDLRRMAKDIRAVGRQAAFAQVVALTRTALDVKKAEVDEISHVFDRPNAYTLNAVFVKPATKAKPEAQVGIKDDRATSNAAIAPNRFLGPNIEGGGRDIKRFEKRLQLDGAMPIGWYAVPGKFARLDAYGNISRGQITQILSQLTRTKVSGYTANISVRSRKGAIKRAGGEFIALPHGRGKLPPGIYQVTDFHAGRAAPRPIVLFVKQVHYTNRFDFHGVAERTAEARYEANLDGALVQYANAGAAP